MALYDHRVFRVGDDWWIAQVHSGSGAGPGAIPTITHERVLFSRVGNEDDGSKTAQIPAGWLNQLSNRSLRRLLARAEHAKFRLDMYPYNAPWADSVRTRDIFTDAEGLQWVIRPTTVVRMGTAGPEARPAVQLVCLDDSALKRDILLEGSDTYDNAVRTIGGGIDEQLVNVVKGTFRELPDRLLEDA